MLVLSAGILIAAGILVVVDGQHVGIGGTGIVLPGTCVSRYVFGLPCPGCGLTRSFVSLAHGDLVESLRFNPAGVLLFALIALQIPFRVMQIWRVRQGLDPWRADWLNGVAIVAAVALIGQWIVRLMLPGWFVS
jgi:hypothetical protein